MNKVEATGATHEVKAEELFFSVTDDRGVITEANKVFVDLSRYELGDLIGAIRTCRVAPFTLCGTH